MASAPITGVEVACVDVPPGEKRPEFAGPEGWHVLAGEQCLETPAGARRARAGGACDR